MQRTHTHTLTHTHTHTLTHTNTHTQRDIHTRVTVPCKIVHPIATSTHMHTHDQLTTYVLKHMFQETASRHNEIWIPTTSFQSKTLFSKTRGRRGNTGDEGGPGGHQRNTQLGSSLSDISFKKTFCLMNIRPQDLLSHEPTVWFRRHQLFWFRRTIFLRRENWSHGRP